MKVVFIPNEKAGAAIRVAVDMLESSGWRRPRRTAFNRIASALRGLNIISSEKVMFIAKGADADGSYGVFIGQLEEGGHGIQAISGESDAQTRP